MRLQTAKVPGIGLRVAGNPATRGLIARVDSDTQHQHDPKWLKQTFLSAGGVGMNSELCPARGHTNGTSSIPHYEIVGGYVCPARGHQGGSSSIPHYQISGEELCPARGHPQGTSSIPHFNIRGTEVCPARGHPDGTSSIPWYSIK